jgi:hypothetical protein
MTQQYIRGEFSVCLGAVCGEHCPKVGHALHDLRMQVECAPSSLLPRLAAEALQVVDAACWTSLERGDVAAFAREAGEAAVLRELATCAGLLP